jgi:predicted MFS family arabinose efflux permease
MKFTHRNSSTQRALIVVTLGFLALALTYSARAVLGLAMPLWETELGWSRSYVSNVAACALLVMALVAPVAGYMLDRKGLRLTLLFGLVAVCLSSIVISIADSRWVLFIGFGIIGGVGFGIVATHVVAAAVARVYPNNVGFASGVATSGSTAGQFLIVPLIAVLLTSFSWRWGFVGIAIGTALLIPFIWLIPRDNTGGSDLNDDAKSQPGSWKADMREVAFNPVFHLLFWSYLICGYTTSGVIETHLLPYASFCGFAALPSATAYGLLSAVNLVGMIGVGWLTDRMNRPLLLGCIYLIRGLTFWLLLNIGTSYENLLLFAVIFGAVDYSTVPVTTSLVASHLGLRVVGFVMGLLTAGHQIGAAIGASLGGYFYATNSSYDLVWISSIALAVIAGLLAFLLKDRPPVNNAELA